MPREQWFLLVYRFAIGTRVAMGRAYYLLPDGTSSAEKGLTMNSLDFVQRELVALGAALGSNCVPCLEHHISEARKSGLTDSQISEAIQFADKIRKVPAAKTLNAALQLLAADAVSSASNDAPCGESASIAIRRDLAALDY